MNVYDREKEPRKESYANALQCPYHQSCGAGGVMVVVLVPYVTLDVLMMDAFLRFFQFLVNNIMVCGRRFWWIWENENYEDKMTIENDFSFTCFPLAFL